MNNVALFTALPEGPFDEFTEENWDRCMEVNLKGVWNCIRSVFQCMKEQRYGKIINISSVTWMMGRPYRLDYVTSKAGVVGLTHAIAPELGEYDINVNSVVLGLVQSESALKAYGAEHFQRFKDRQVFKRSLTPQDACGAVVFLASDDDEMITGQSLVVDGGLVFHEPRLCINSCHEGTKGRRDEGTSRWLATSGSPERLARTIYNLSAAAAGSSVRTV